MVLFIEVKYWILKWKKDVNWIKLLLRWSKVFLSFLFSLFSLSLFLFFFSLFSLFSLSLFFLFLFFLSFLFFLFFLFKINLYKRSTQLEPRRRKKTFVAISVIIGCRGLSWDLSRSKGAIRGCDTRSCWCWICFFFFVELLIKQKNN